MRTEPRPAAPAAETRKSLEWIAGEIDRRVTRPLYARVRAGDTDLAEVLFHLLPAGGECELPAWRTGTRERNARALLLHVDRALAALRRAPAGADLRKELQRLRDEVWRRSLPDASTENGHAV